MSESDAVTRRSIGSRDVTTWRSAGGRRLVAAHRRLADRVGRGPAAVAALAGGAAVLVPAVWATTVLYDAVAGRQGIERIDRPVLRRAMRLRSPAVDGVAAGIARAFGPVGMPLLTAAVTGLLVARTRDREDVGVVAAAAGGSLLMTIGGKGVVRRHRPPLHDAIPPFEHSPSFPSGHTMNATTVAGAIAYLLMLRQRGTGAQVATAASAATVAGTVGLSRVLLGAHWFTDVATGWTAGTGWLATVITVHRLHLTLRREAG